MGKKYEKKDPRKVRKLMGKMGLTHIIEVVDSYKDLRVEIRNEGIGGSAQRKTN